MYVYQVKMKKECIVLVDRDQNFPDHYAKSLALVKI